MPKPGSGETEADFIGRCVPIVLEEGTAKDNEQAVAICYSIWREQKMNMNDILLKAIRSRQQKRTEFGYGILTADRYVQTMLDAAGLEVCHRYGSTKQTSFLDAMEKASQTLVYSNEDMEVLEKARDSFKSVKLPDEVELPKNCLMVFKHVLTTPRKDRDGDILRTEGLSVDPKMLLLWQHVHTMPIGKMLAVAEHSNKRISLYSCIIDMNDLCHDAAVMVDNEMGRFSHGFRALEFDRVKARDGEEAGFDIKRGEIIEESLVSVPANIDAQTEEVLLSLVEGGKLTSPIMKQVGRGIRDHRPVSVPVQLNLKVMLNGQEVKCEDEPGSRKEEEKADGVTPPEETNEGDEVQVEKAKDDKVEDQEKPVEGVDVCPKCGSENINDGVCGDCGAKVEAEEEPEEEKASDKVCAECGGDIGEDGACKECGAKPGKEEEKPEDEDKSAPVLQTKGLPYGQLLGSWEFIAQELRSKAEKFLADSGRIKSMPVDQPRNYWVGIVATYLDYCIVGIESMTTSPPDTYYKCKWQAGPDGKPEFIGEPKEVEVSVSTVIREKELLAKVKSTCVGFKTNPNVDHAMSVVLAHASREQRNKMVGLLQSLQEIDKRTDKVKQYLSIVGRS